MTDKFTKGPWTLEQEATWPFGLWTKAADGTVIACDDLASYSTGDTMEEANAREGNAERIANAKIRAAAPSLLEALEEVREWISAWDPDFIHDDEWSATADKMRAAIASARGER